MPNPTPADRPPQTPAAAGPGSAIDPFRNYNFKLVVGQGIQGHFTQCSGIGIRVQAIQYREAGAGSVVRRLPGPVEYSDVTLRYGVTTSPELWTWFMSAVNGQVERRNVSIVMVAIDGTEIQWDLADAWPQEWRGAPLDTLGREVAVESLTLVYESVSRQG